MEEIWKKVKDHNGYYISNFGKLKSYVRYSEGRIIKPWKAKSHKKLNDYYLRYSLGRENKILAHRLVAIAFLPNPNNLPCINHKDGNKINNCISNLEWVSYSENNKHAYLNNLKFPSTKNRRK